MKWLTKLLKWCLGVFLCAWAGQYLLALVIPNLVMEFLYQRDESHRVGTVVKVT
jgi:hypothetical protein